MIPLVTELATGVVAIATLFFVHRLIAGPTVLDRAVAFEGIAINAIILIVLAGIRFHSIMFFDAAVALAILSFIGAVALGKYVERGEIIDRDSV